MHAASSVARSARRPAAAVENAVAKIGRQAPHHRLTRSALAPRLSKCKKIAPLFKRQHVKMIIFYREPSVYV